MPTPSRRSRLQEDTYFRDLRMLQDNPDLTQRDIAERLDVSTSGMNYCLNALIDKGWGRQADPKSRYRDRKRLASEWSNGEVKNE